MRRLCERANITPADIGVLIHGFTIATNAWLTRSGARVVLATTAGFRDVLEIATQRRADPYDLHLQALRPLAQRACVIEVDERIDAFGDVVTGLTEAMAEATADRIVALEPEAVAISLLFSYMNVAHERILAEAVRRRLPGTPVYISAEINPQIDEYPRTNTTVTAAYVGPAVSRYISLLETTLPRAGLHAPILLMRSDGGVSTVAARAGQSSDDAAVRPGRRRHCEPCAQPGAGGPQRRHLRYGWNFGGFLPDCGRPRAVDQ